MTGLLGTNLAQLYSLINVFFLKKLVYNKDYFDTNWIGWIE